MAAGEGIHRQSQPPHLSPRMREVVEGLADGYTILEIAEQLVVSPNTVKSHLRLASVATGCHTSAGIVAASLRRGWIR